MSKKREHRETSSEAHEEIKPHKQAAYEKIVEALKKLKVGGTFYEIAEAAGMEPLQVCRRLDEMVKAGLVYNCDYTHKTPTGRNSMVRQLIGLGYKNESQEPVKKKKEPVILDVPPMQKIKKQIDLF